MSSNTESSETRCVVVHSVFGERKKIRIFTGSDAEDIKQKFNQIIKEGETDAAKHTR